MCVAAPIALAVASLAVTSASAVASHVSQNSEADRVEKDSHEAYEENKRSAITAATLNERELSLRESEELLASGTAKQDITRQELSVLSTSRVAAADAGVSGHSVDAVQNDIQRQASDQRSRIDTNTDLTVDQLEREKESVLVQAQSQINSVRPVTARRPSILTPALQIAGAGLDAYDYVSSRKRKP